MLSTKDKKCQVNGKPFPATNKPRPKHNPDAGSEDWTKRQKGVVWHRENLWLLLGFELKATPVEILYNEIGENRVNVFHAMPCRSQFYRLFEGDITP
jgi:hypothetical protein